VTEKRERNIKMSRPTGGDIAIHWVAWASGPGLVNTIVGGDLNGAYRTWQDEVGTEK